MRTNDPAAYGTHSLTQEQAAPIATRNQRAIFLSYPPAAQERIRAEVLQRLRDEARKAEFSARDDRGRRPGSALARMAREVYGVWISEE